jgi:hypothetical protein
MRTAPLVTAALVAAVFAASAVAKLPPPTEEAKAKAAEAAAKTAWADKVGAYKLCLAQDRAVQNYRASAKTTGAILPATPSAPTAGCMDPGPYVATQVTPAANKPLEASGAHSPSGMAVSPPSQKANAAEIAGGVKKPAPN